MIKIDWNDISIIPDTLSSISSRSEINPLLNGNLPIFVSPMDTVVDENNYTKFIELGINVCLPRHIKYESLKDDRVFYSYGLDEIIDIFEKSNSLPKKVLIDEVLADKSIGRTEHDSPDVDNIVIFEGETNLKVGEFVEAKIIDAGEYELYAEV